MRTWSDGGSARRSRGTSPCEAAQMVKWCAVSPSSSRSSGVTTVEAANETSLSQCSVCQAPCGCIRSCGAPHERLVRRRSRKRQRSGAHAGQQQAALRTERGVGERFSAASKATRASRHTPRRRRPWWPARSLRLQTQSRERRRGTTCAAQRGKASSHKRKRCRAALLTRERHERAREREVQMQAVRRTG